MSEQINSEQWTKDDRRWAKVQGQIGIVFAKLMSHHPRSTCRAWQYVKMCRFFRDKIHAVSGVWICLDIWTDELSDPFGVWACFGQGHDTFESTLQGEEVACSQTRGDLCCLEVFDTRIWFVFLGKGQVRPTFWGRCSVHTWLKDRVGAVLVNEIEVFEDQKIAGSQRGRRSSLLTAKRLITILSNPMVRAYVVVRVNIAMRQRFKHRTGNFFQNHLECTCRASLKRIY